MYVVNKYVCRVRVMFLEHILGVCGIGKVNDCSWDMQKMLCFGFDLASVG